MFLFGTLLLSDFITDICLVVDTETSLAEEKKDERQRLCATIRFSIPLSQMWHISDVIRQMSHLMQSHPGKWRGSWGMVWSR